MGKLSTFQRISSFNNIPGFRPLIISLAILLLISNDEIVSAQSTLTWDPPGYVQNIDGYKVYYGNTRRNYPEHKKIEDKNQTSLPLDFLADGDTYYLTVTSYNLSGLESVYSNEVTYTYTDSGNQPPNAVDDSATTTENTPIDINVITNDSDPDGTIDPATVSLIIFPTNGNSVSNGDGTITYSPDLWYTGQDTFKYIVQDDYGSTSNVSTVSVAVSSVSPYYIDEFNSDTTGNYTVTNTWTTGGVGSFIYDTTGKRAEVRTGDNVALLFSRNLPVLGTGTFSIDFRPTTKYPFGGIINLYLRQDANNYYLLQNSDGYGAKSLRKYVGGTVVDSASFSSQYSQNSNYTITINFSPGLTTVNAFGEVLTINSNSSSIMVGSFEVESMQQHAYYDNISYKD